MSDLVVIGFKGDRSRASHALDRLRELDFRWVVDLEGAVAMFRDLDGTLHVRQDRPFIWAVAQITALGQYLGKRVAGPKS